MLFARPRADRGCLPSRIGPLTTSPGPLWAEATDQERRVIVKELMESVAMFPDHFEVTVSEVPRLNVTLEEVGLSGGWQSCGVGGETCTITPQGSVMREFRTAA